MKKIALLSALCCFVILGACKEDEKKADPSAEMMKEVLAVHDEVMAEMPTISKLVATLKPKIDSTEQGMAYKKTMIGLQESNTEMMNWMQRFSERFDSDEIMNGKELTSEKKQWLIEEKEKIEALKLRFNSQISGARAIIKN